MYQRYISHYITHIFFFNDTATTEIYTLSLHDALPICPRAFGTCRYHVATMIHPRVDDLLQNVDSRYALVIVAAKRARQDRKSTRLNSSHQIISYAVFCLKQKIASIEYF